MIAQPSSAGGTQYIVQIYTVILNQNGSFATQALQLAVSATLSSPGNQPLFALAVLAGNFDASINPAGGLPQDELAVVAHAGPALVIVGLRAQVSSTSSTITQVTRSSRRTRCRRAARCCRVRSSP